MPCYEPSPPTDEEFRLNERLDISRETQDYLDRNLCLACKALDTDKLNEIHIIFNEKPIYLREWYIAHLLDDLRVADTTEKRLYAKSELERMRYFG